MNQSNDQPISPYLCEHEQVMLRSLHDQDCDMIRTWRNQDNIRPYFMYDQVITPQQHQEWYEQYKCNPRHMLFIIESPQYRQGSLGMVGIRQDEDDPTRAEYGWCMLPHNEDRGRGLMYAASQAMFSYLRVNSPVLQLYLQVKTSNQKAQRTYNKLGFAPDRIKGNVMWMLMPL